ncbi:MAG TPA: hypothetical protein VE865_13755 [Bradyrhizobium sp.]|nr:hypothetical protein [Bradyrhizobium sp.]
MLKLVTALSAALIMGIALVGSATTASAGGYHRGGGGYGGCCGPLRPSYSVTTRQVHKHIRHNRDVYHTKYFKRYKKYVHITRIQPVYHIHTVTRHHTKLVGVVVPTYRRETVYLHPKTIRTSSSVYLRPQCSCGGGHHGGY